jgi:hypothetical protein
VDEGVIVVGGQVRVLGLDVHGQGVVIRGQPDLQGVTHISKPEGCHDRGPARTTTPLA